MKKVLAIFLAISFCLSAIGMEVTVHECMGKVSYKIFGFDFNKHCKCKHEEESHKSRCCNNHTVRFKSAVDAFSSLFKTISFQQVFTIKLFVQTRDLFLVPSLSNVQSLATDHPPPERTTSLHVLFCVYRI